MDDNLNKKSKELFNEMDDNTQFNDDKNQLRFAKMNLDAELVDYVMDHYGFLDLPEMNLMCIRLIHIMAQMENAGFSFSMYKTIKDENNQDKVSESYKLDLHDLIYKIQLLEIQKKENKKDEKSSM